jgi:hypothetical protein
MLGPYLHLIQRGATMLCTWNRYDSATTPWQRAAENALQHRQRSLSFLRIVDHLLCVAAATTAACMLTSLLD